MNLLIISGGQTGADRAALDFALTHRIPHGGWCPKGRKAEDGEIPARYALTEAASKDYARRTDLNVCNSDATVIFSIAETLKRGSKRTAETAARNRKPCLHLSRARLSAETAADELRRFVCEHRVERLNVAGSRASKEPEISAYVAAVLERAFMAL